MSRTGLPASSREPGLSPPSPAGTPAHRPLAPAAGGMFVPPRWSLSSRVRDSHRLPAPCSGCPGWASAAGLGHLLVIGWPVPVVPGLGSCEPQFLPQKTGLDLLVMPTRSAGCSSTPASPPRLFPRPVPAGSIDSPRPFISAALGAGLLLGGIQSLQASPGRVLTCCICKRRAEGRRQVGRKTVSGRGLGLPI